VSSQPRSRKGRFSQTGPPQEGEWLVVRRTGRARVSAQIRCPDSSSNEGTQTAGAWHAGRALPSSPGQAMVQGSSPRARAPGDRGATASGRPRQTVISCSSSAVRSDYFALDCGRVETACQVREGMRRGGRLHSSQDAPRCQNGLFTT